MKKLLLVLLKHHTMEALLIMEKEKFKEAIEEWKNKYDTAIEKLIQ